MYEHLNWANQRILETLQSIEDKNQEVCRLFSHILFAEKVWITRLKNWTVHDCPYGQRSI